MKTVVAVAQMTSTSEKEANLKQVESIIKKAAHLGVKLLGLPENFAYMGEHDEESIKKVSEPMDGPTLRGLSLLAIKYRIWLSLGGFLEKSLNSDKVYNSHFLLDEHGKIVASYQKIHLFSVQLPDASVYDESRFITSGSEIVVADTPFACLGLSVCYDVRFFGLYRALRKLGAEVLLVPAAFTEITGKAHWEVLLRARAIETQSYVLAAAQIGRHNENRSTYGHAMIIDPWGTVVAECSSTDQLAIAEIDLNYLRKLRIQMPVSNHQRLDLYGHY